MCVFMCVPVQACTTLDETNWNCLLQNDEGWQQQYPSSIGTICGRICAVTLEANDNGLWKGEFNIADTHIQTISIKTICVCSQM